MGISKADYDELVRLRGINMQYITRGLDGGLFATDSQGFTVSIRGKKFKSLERKNGKLNIAAAIAGYEGEHKEDA